MKDKTLKSLEFYKVIDIIKSFAYSKKAKEYISGIIPIDNPYLIRENLNQLDEMFRYNMKFGSIPIGGYLSCKDIAKRASKGGILSNRELLDVSKSLKCAKEVKNNVLNKLKEEKEEDFENLLNYVRNIETLSSLQNEIESIIISESEISDNASSELSAIRRAIKNANNKVREKLTSIISSSTYKTYLSENIVTMRLGRYVVPVKSEYQGKVKGIIHDTSQSGATVFIEPEGVVALNNEIKNLQLMEKDEVERILYDLSNKVGSNYDGIFLNENILVNIDVLCAKSNFSIKYNLSKPNIREDKVIDLKKAWHILIEEKKVVKNDISLGREYGMLIITGPNTGGKTVTLKTVGLCALLMQSGIFIPAMENSSMPIFNKIYCDIGDEQSIMQNLSTFSSHMTNIIDIINNADDSTLILLDELGAGTDPVEGSAIARGILDDLNEKEALVFATTHYAEIKEYAIIRKDVINASMEFDVLTLSPTYKLMIGIPGKSNAFEISSKLGLCQKILDRSKKYLSSEDKDFEELSAELNEKISILEKERIESNKIYEENLKINQRIKDKEETLKKSTEKIMLEASLKAKNIIKDAKTTSKEIIDKLNETKEISSSVRINKKLEEEVKKAKERFKEEEQLLNSYIPSHEIKKVDKSISDKKTDFKVVDDVYIKSLDQKASILWFDNKGNVFIQAGIIKTKIPIQNIEKTKNAEKNTEKTVYKFANEKSSVISPKLDIRGYYGDDAILEIEKYLDDAFLANLKQVTIVHGKGTGVLKKVVHDVAKKHSNVKSYRFGEFNEGSDGATIIDLK